MAPDKASSFSYIFQAHYEIFQTFRCNRVQVGNGASNQWCLEVRDVVYREFSNGYRVTLKFGHFNIFVKKLSESRHSV